MNHTDGRNGPLIMNSGLTPENEKTIFGSSSGFTDSLQINLELLRERINHSCFQVRTFTVGSNFKQTVAFVYLENTVKHEVLESLNSRLTALQAEPLLGAGQLEQFFKDFPQSPFPGFQMTELLQLAVTALFKGKIIVLLDGYPTVLIAPTDFFGFFRTTDDYNFNWYFRILLPCLRLIAVTVAVFLPAFYVAVISYHYYVLPLNIIQPLAESRLRVPFPPVIEMLLLEIFMEILREGAIRRGSSLVLTSGGIGALLACAGAIATGFLSPFSIVLSGITQIATLALPVKDLIQTIRLLKFGALIATGIFGILGTVVFASVTVVHLIILESAGQPYFQPFELLKQKFHDSIRFNRYILRKRRNK